MWVWLWLWTWTGVALSVGQGASVGRGTILQDFPIAAEENFYSFNPDGTYTFSYDTGGGKHQSFRIEMRDASGKVSGRFGYVDPAGALHITEYQADSGGYRASVEVYHQVSLAPPEPLVVGPLPKRPPSTPKPPEDLPKPPTMRPVGPAPFFPPPQSILIIGTLPKPLQPEDSEPDEDAPDLDEESLFILPSDPPVPNVVPLSPVGNTSPRDRLNTPPGTDVVSILQGTLTDIPQEPSEDDSSTNSTVPAPDVLPEDRDQPGESKEPGNGGPGQAGAPSIAHTNRRLPELPQPTKDSDSVTQLEDDKINPTKTNPEIKAKNRTQSSHHTAEDTHDSDSVQHKYFPNSESLQPSATTITTSTISRLAERGAHGPTPAVVSTSLVLPATQEDTKSQPRASHNPPPPSPPPLTYLPVGAPRHQYPTAPLLQLPQRPKSYPA